MDVSSLRVKKKSIWKIITSLAETRTHSRTRPAAQSWRDNNNNNNNKKMWEACRGSVKRIDGKQPQIPTPQSFSLFSVVDFTTLYVQFQRLSHTHRQCRRPKKRKQSAGHGGIDSRHIKNNFIPDVIWSVIVTIFFRGYSFSIISLG